jgi:hypothetical protein
MALKVIAVAAATFRGSWYHRRTKLDVGCGRNKTGLVWADPRIKPKSCIIKRCGVEAALERSTIWEKRDRVFLTRQFIFFDVVSMFRFLWGICR